MATQRNEEVHKQDEIDMTNAKPNMTVANATIFHHSHWASYESARVGGRSTRLFSYQHVGICKEKCSSWGLGPMRGPNSCGFVFWWNIGLTVKK